MPLFEQDADLFLKGSSGGQNTRQSASDLAPEAKHRLKAWTCAASNSEPHRHAFVPALLCKRSGRAAFPQDGIRRAMHGASRRCRADEGQQASNPAADDPSAFRTSRRAGRRKDLHSDS